MALRAGAPLGIQKAPGATSAGARRHLGMRWSAALFSLLAGAVLAYLYVTYLRSGDVAPDSVYGYGFAIAGTALLALVGVGYVVRKRLHRNWSGLLHTALTWHVAGGLLGLALILMHAIGNFHPRTGTYALYALMALVVSGIIGRQLDRIAPRLAARAALSTLTPDGEERLEALVGVLRASRRNRRWQRRSSSRPTKIDIPWDLAYYDLDAQPEDIPGLLTHPGIHEVGADRAASRRPETKVSIPMGDAAKDAMASESAAIRRAIGRERFYLRLIRVWRWLHTALSVVTLALILWHLEYAATLLMNAR